MIIYLDTETSGLYPGEICQLSYIIQNKSSVTAKNFFFTVSYVEYGAYKVHGFSVEELEKLSNGKDFSCFVKEIEKDFTASDYLVSHNTAFDFMFLRKEFFRTGRDFIYNNEFCSMKKSVNICKIKKLKGAGYKYPKLEELCSFFNIGVQEINDKTKELFKESKTFHDARFDTTAMFLAINEGFNLGYYQELKDYL